MNWDFIITFITAAVLTGTTLMYGTLGEILTEKSGNLNLGVEGLMFMGAPPVSLLLTIMKQAVQILPPFFLR